ncbi:hypothetical protein ABIA39_008300 [Nocardia sp. GAS34]
MTTLDPVTRKNKPVQASAEALAAQELVRMAKEQGLSLTGPVGLLKQFTKTVLETALNEEMTDHLGFDKGQAPEERETSNVRNGTRPKTVLTETTGHVQIDVPRDRDSTFEPQIVKKRQRRLSGVDEIVFSLYAKGLTAREISAHFAEIYGASVSKETVSRITDKVIAEMQEWAARPLDQVYVAVFIDAIVVKVRDGQVANRPVYAAIGVTVNGEKDILGLWAGTGGEGAKFWMSVLTDIRNRGVKDVFFVVCDGLKGLPDVVGNVWPLATVQTCIIHWSRKDSTWRFAVPIWRDMGENLCGSGEFACGRGGDEAVLVEQWCDVVDGVADGAAADAEQLGEGVLVAYRHHQGFPCCDPHRRGRRPHRRAPGHSRGERAHRRILQRGRPGAVVKTAHLLNPPDTHRVSLYSWSLRGARVRGMTASPLRARVRFRTCRAGSARVRGLAGRRPSVR